MQPTARPPFHRVLLGAVPLVAGMALQACEDSSTEPLSSLRSSASGSPAGTVSGSAELAHIVPGRTMILVWKDAKLADGGPDVIVRGSVACVPVGGVDIPLEALVTVNQAGFEGEGFIQGIVCDGNPRPWRARVIAIDGAYTTGEAFASAFVLVCDDDGSECASDGNSRHVTIRRRF